MVGAFGCSLNGVNLVISPSHFLYSGYGEFPEKCGSNFLQIHSNGLVHGSLSAIAGVNMSEIMAGRSRPPASAMWLEIAEHFSCPGGFDMMNTTVHIQRSRRPLWGFPVEAAGIKERRQPMITMELTPEEAAVLRRVLLCCLSELRDEIGHTDSRECRELLRGEEAVLRKVIGHIEKEGAEKTT